MKKRLLSSTLSGTILFSTIFGSIPVNVFAKPISSTEPQAQGVLLFPNDVISFDTVGKIIYNGGESQKKEIPVESRMIILPGYSDVFNQSKSDFYGWKIINDTINPETGKRSSLEVAPLFIGYDSEKADLTITYPAGGTDTTPSLKLTAKPDYILEAVGNGITLDTETGAITLPSSITDNDSKIPLGDTYTENGVTVTLYKDGVIPQELTACPKISTSMQFTATALRPSGAPSGETVTWSLNDDIEEFISISDTGLVTITPYFVGDDFTVTAKSGNSEDSVTVKMEHKYGEWKETLAPTIDAPGTEEHICTLCSAPESRPLEKLQSTGLPTGTISVNNTQTWSKLAVSEKYIPLKSASFVITAIDDVEVKNVSYLLSPFLLTKEQLDAQPEWIPGKEFSITQNATFYIYVKITDNTDNVTYISTDGIILDSIPPVINGITNNTTYHETQKFTVTDSNLDSVTVNGVPVYPENGFFTLSAENLQGNNYQYTIVAADKSGNSVAYTGYIMKPVTADNKIEGITEDATYRRGSIIKFNVIGDDMDNNSPRDGDTRYLPYSYTIAKRTENINGRFDQVIITSNYSIGRHTLDVLFKEQVFTTAGGWADTGITDTKSVPFGILKREEIESVRGTPRASFFTIKFETNGGTKIDYVLVNRLKFLKEPVSPTKVGYRFEGWYTNEALTKEYDFSERVSKNMTLYAKWEKTSQIADDEIFSDVSKDDWYYDNISYVYASGLMNGTGNAEFSPDMPTTRAMIVTILYRLEGEPSASYSSFYDVSKDSYYAKAVAWAEKNGIVNGISPSTFAPDKEISREQLMTILYRFAEYKDYDRSSKAGLGNYTDADQIAYYANSAFQWAVATKVAAGRTEKFLSPKASATRAEVAMAFRNFIEGNVM